MTDVAELLRSFPGDSGGTGGSAAGSGDDGGESALSSRRNAYEEGVTPPEAVEEWDWSSPAQVAKDAADVVMDVPDLRRVWDVISSWD